MASIQLLNRTASSITVYLSGLDTNYGSSDRRAEYWYKKASSSSYIFKGEHNLPAYIASTINGGTCTFSGLDASEPYDIKVEIGGISGGNVSTKVLTRKIWTLDAEPEVDDFQCVAEASHENDAFYARCLFNVSNVLEGTTTYEIYARQSGTSKWYLKSGADIYHINVLYGTTGKHATGSIGVRLYDEEAFTKTYDLKLVVTTNETTTEHQENGITFHKNWIKSFNGYQDPVNEPSVYFYFSLYGDNANGNFVTNSLIPIGSDANILLYDERDEFLYAIPLGTTPSLGRRLTADLDYGRYIARLYIDVPEHTDENGNTVLAKQDYLECDIEISANSPIINNFYIKQESSDNHEVTCYVDLSGVVVGTTVYKIFARQKGSTEWWQKTVAYNVIEGERFSVNVTLDIVGDYEFRLAVATDNKEVFAEASYVTKDLWQWSKIYKDLFGNANLELSANVLVPIVNNEFRPITAEDWRNFTTRINKLRTYLNLNNYTFTTVSQGDDFTPAIYNEAVRAIKGIGQGAGELLAEIADTTELCANLFLSLKNELNAAITNLQ